MIETVGLARLVLSVSGRLVSCEEFARAMLHHEGGEIMHGRISLHIQLLAHIVNKKAPN